MSDDELILRITIDVGENRLGFGVAEHHNTIRFAYRSAEEAAVIMTERVLAKMKLELAKALAKEMRVIRGEPEEP